MKYEIRNQDGIVYGMAPDRIIASIFAQALRKLDRDTDYTIHEGS